MDPNQTLIRVQTVCKVYQQTMLGEELTYSSIGMTHEQIQKGFLEGVQLREHFTFIIPAFFFRKNRI